VQENDRFSEISRDFKDPGMMSVSSHDIQVDGIFRNMVFNLRGSTATYRRDVFVCSQLDGWADMVAGAKFIAKEFAILFSKAKRMFAGIFSFKKETRGMFFPFGLRCFEADNFILEEKIQKQKLQDQADLEFEESERLRRQQKAKEERDKEEARRRKREAELQTAHNGHAASRL
jgi:hypothetical protein